LEQLFSLLDMVFVELMIHQQQFLLIGEK
jgi:hypothetical protein